MIILKTKNYTFADKRALEELKNVLRGGNKIPKGFLEKLSKDEKMADQLQLFLQRQNLLTLNRDASTRKALSSLGNKDNYINELLTKAISEDKDFLKKLNLNETANDLEHLYKKKYDPELLERWMKIKLKSDKGKKDLNNYYTDLYNQIVKARDAESLSSKAREAALQDTNANPLFKDKKHAHELYRKMFPGENPSEYVKISKEEINNGTHSYYRPGMHGKTDEIGIRQDTHNELGSISHEKGHMHHLLKVAEEIGTPGNTAHAYEYLKAQFRLHGANKLDRDNAAMSKLLKRNMQLNNEANASAYGIAELRKAGATDEEILHAINSLSPAYNSYLNHQQAADIQNEMDYIQSLITKYNKK